MLFRYNYVLYRISSPETIRFWPADPLIDRLADLPIDRPTDGRTDWQLLQNSYKTLVSFEYCTNIEVYVCNKKQICWNLIKNIQSKLLLAKWAF